MTETVAPGHGVANAADLLSRLGTTPPHARSVPFATGFEPLDDVLRGGVRAQDLVVLGGGPGIGKTIVALQWARWMAMHGQTAIYVSYSHAPILLLRQLLGIELASLARLDETEVLTRLQTISEEVVLGALPPSSLTADPLGEEAYQRLSEYGRRLHLVAASGRATGIIDLAHLVAEHRDGPTAVFVDYLQRISSVETLDDGDARATQTADQLKELAMVAAVPVVALAASDRAGLTAPRLRLYHLSHSSALAHAADIAIVMNAKPRVATSSHLTVNPTRAEQFEQWVVLSVEKNRSGTAPIDLEFRKDFANYRFDPNGQFVNDSWDAPF